MSKHKRAAYIPPHRLEEIRKRLPPRDRYITDLLVATGFRVDDIMHVRRWQLSKDKLTIKEMKTGKIRTVSIPEELILRNGEGESHAKGWALAFAFPSLRGGGKHKMHRTTYWRHFKDAVRRAGFKDKQYSPHSLRKVYAVNLFRRKGISAVQDDLGHKYEGTTYIYALSDQV